MSGRPRTPKQSNSEFTGKITRQLVNKAEDMLGSVLDSSEIDAMLSQVVQASDELADSERQQLAEIAKLLEHGSGTSEGGSALTCNGSFELTPSEDQMFLKLTVHPPLASGEPVTVDDVLGWLKERSISLGVDLNAIKRAVQTAAAGEDVADVPVVTGRAARPGRDAFIERFARRASDGPLEPFNDRMLSRTDDPLMCRQGDVVLRYHPPEPGEPGHNALGEAIQPPEPQDIQIEAGKNITREDTDFRTEVSGVVIFEDERVDASKALIINQDVTRKSDPIDFDGEVHVRAAVRSGAHVRSTGNIVVDGPVESAEIESTEGDVVLRSGVAGQGSAVIRAGRDVNARFSESASIFANRDITLQVGSLHSRLIAYHQINAIQGKGHLAGGVLIAGERICVKQLGAKGGVRTDVTVGLTPETLETLSQVDQLVARTTQRQNTCDELISQMERAVGDPAKLQARELQVYTKLRQVQLVCDVQVRRLNQRRRDVLAEAERNHGGRVEVLLSIMPNVHITIGGAEDVLEGRHGPCTVTSDDHTNKLTVRAGT